MSLCVPLERAVTPCPWAGGEKVCTEDSVVHRWRQSVHNICYSIILVKCLGIFPSHDLFSTQLFYASLPRFGISEINLFSRLCPAPLFH